MGVNGLWDVLRPAAQPRSHYHLALVDGFEANTNGLRGFRIGIDASLWFYHAESGREGENPELRTLFFRCTRLLNKPFLPVFVFDGPKRPSIKRGKRVAETQHWMISGMKAIINAFGFEWRMAPGEAEAELAYLNSIGQIDAVLSDDVDTFLFGATMVIRNTSATLTGNIAHPVLNSDGRDDKEHSHTYKAHDIAHHSSIRLTRGGMILIGLLSGGDYDDGVKGCGMKTAHGLARCGYGDELLEATNTRARDELPAFLTDWRARIRAELKTNARGILDRKTPKLARELPEDWPSLDVLYLYTHPVTSKTDASARRTHGPLEWKKEPDFGGIANVCEIYFEWGFEESIIKRFRTVLWSGALQRVFRRAVLEDDARRRGDPVVSPAQTSSSGATFVGTPFALVKNYFSKEDVLRPESALVQKIHASRTAAITDRLLEYRVSILPETFVLLTSAGIKNTRQPVDTTYDVLPSDMEGDGDDDEGGKKKRGPREPADPLAPYRVWVPASLVRIVHPDLAEEFEGAGARKEAAKAAKAARAADRAAGIPAVGAAPKPRRGRKRVPADFPMPMDDEELECFDIDEVSGPEDGAPRVAAQAGRSRPPSKSKPAYPAATRRPRKKAPAPAPFPDIYADDPYPPDPAPERLRDSRSPAPAPAPAPIAPLYLDDDDEPPAPLPIFPSRPPPGPSTTVKGYFSVSKTTVSMKSKTQTTSINIERTVDLTTRRTPTQLLDTPSTSGASSTVSSTTSIRTTSQTASGVLDRLEKAMAKSRTFSRTASANSATSMMSSASKSAPQEFPMIFEREETISDDDDDRDALPPPPRPPPPPARSAHPERTTSNRRPRTPSISEDTDLETPRKSPRRNAKHSSPRAIDLEQRSSPTPSPPRPAPRTAPARRPPAAPHRPRKLDDSIIEITSSSSSGSSSGEDDLPAVGDLIASAMGRAPPIRMGKQLTALPASQGRRTPAPSTAVAVGDVSVIDLT